MTLLESIAGPARSQGAQPRPAARPGQRDPRLPHRDRVPQRRPPRPEPRRGRAHHRAAPGLRLAGRTGSSSTPATSPTCTSCSPAGQAGFGTLRQRGGLSGYPSQAESEHDVVGELARLHQPVLRRRAGQGVPAARGDRPHAWSRSIGDGALTGGMAWEALNNIAAPRTAGWSSSSTTTAGPTSRRSAAWPPTWPSVRMPRSGTSTCWSTSRPRCRARRWSARRCTRRCTASRRASRTSSSRRCCSRTSGSSTSARSTATTSSLSSRRCAGPGTSAAR